jgi:hypothetical protein
MGKDIKVRVSGYGDYVAVDVVDVEGRIIETPVYVTNKTPVLLRTSKPDSERLDSEFFDEWELSLSVGKLYIRWINGIIGNKSIKQEINPNELLCLKPDLVYRNSSSQII